MREFEKKSNELFPDSKMQELVERKVPIRPEQMGPLQAELKRIGAEFRRIISNTPCDLPGSPSEDTHSERLEWVDSMFLNPIEKLLEALEPNNRHMLSLWPNEVVDELMPDFEQAADQLRHLQLLGRNVAITIVQHRYAKLPIGKLLRFKIVSSICDALESHVPQFKPSRGTYSKKQYRGIYPDAVRFIFAEMTGLNEQLDHLIQEWIDDRKA